MIEWRDRYSDTDEFDKHGRWARIAYVNGLQIGWLSGVITGDDKFYTVKTVFPVSGSDLAIGIFSRANPEECKEWLEKEWNNFVEKIK